MVMTMHKKQQEVRCFKDDAVMVLEKGGAYYRCTLCGLLAERVDYDYEKVKADFEGELSGRLRPTEEDYETDPNDGAEKPWGHMAPKRKEKPKPGAFEIGVPDPGPVQRYKLDA